MKKQAINSSSSLNVFSTFDPGPDFDIVYLLAESKLFFNRVVDRAFFPGRLMAFSLPPRPAVRTAHALCACSCTQHTFFSPGTNHSQQPGIICDALVPL